jgi:hypothetical protein
LQLLKVQVQKEIMELTGMAPGPGGEGAIPLAPQQLPDGDVLGDGIEGAPQSDAEGNIADVEAETGKMIEEQTEGALREELVTKAFGTKIPQRRAVDRD